MVSCLFLLFQLNETVEFLYFLKQIIFLNIIIFKNNSFKNTAFLKFEKMSYSTPPTIKK